MSEEKVTVGGPRSLSIKNLRLSLREVGKIKIGNKGAVRKSASGSEWQAPQKLDHFLVTTMERGPDGNFIIDEKLSNPGLKEIPIRLIYDDPDLNFQTRYICYYGRTVFCDGDGESARRLIDKQGNIELVPCPCERQDPKYSDEGKAAGVGRCKINGILSVIIDGADVVGGVWKFRTTSYNSVVGIASSLELIRRVTGGRLAGIPLSMSVSPKQVASPLDGKQQTVYVVGVQFVGGTQELRNIGLAIARAEAQHGVSMERLEEDARAQLTHNPMDRSAGHEDITAEFYPEEAEEALLRDEEENANQGEFIDIVPEETAPGAPPAAEIKAPAATLPPASAKPAGLFAAGQVAEKKNAMFSMSPEERAPESDPFTDNVVVANPLGGRPPKVTPPTISGRVQECMDIIGQLASVMKVDGYFEEHGGVLRAELGDEEYDKLVVYGNGHKKFIKDTAKKELGRS